MRSWLAVVVLACLAFLPGHGRAQGIDCSRARSATEHAICASPTLLALDHQVAVAYADALARQPDRRDALRTELLAWLRSRDATCNVPAAAIERCLSTQLTARLAALTPPAATQPAPAARPDTAANAPPATVAPLPPASTPSLPDPAIPDASHNQPAPAATLDVAGLPAAPEADTLLHVTSPGRFTIAAHSPSGAALQLVDMLTGPSDLAGAAGAQDGRLDRLLDIGTYKIRAFSAEGASGTVRLTVTPFHDAAPPAALPSANRPLAATLKDGEQRAYWLLVPPANGPNIRIEAAGRSLADLRIWRDGRELTALDPASSIVTPATGHPLTDLHLNGTLEPGTYLVVAYGGPAQPWTDNSADQPFLLRSGLRDDLAEGWAGGSVGPFGSETFAVPSFARSLRLDLPAPAHVVLAAGDATATIEKTSREPTASLGVTPGRADGVEIRAAAGQAFTLRAVDSTMQTSWYRSGTWWVSAATTGMGGDEVPPTYLLERQESDGSPPRIVGGNAPVITPGNAYHARFNVRGRTELLFQTPGGGDVAFSTTGVDIRGGRSARTALPPGYFMLALEPKPGAVGSLDAIVGTPGATPPPLATPLPPDPVLPLGLQTLSPGQSLILDPGSASNATIGLVVRAAPVRLVEGPLIQTVAAGSSLAVPVEIAPGGTLSVTELGAGPIAAGQGDNTQPGRTTVVIPVSDRPRTIALAWHRTQRAPPPIPAPLPPGQLAAVTANTPRFLDLARGEERGFELSVPDGGLFRVETLGRLHTTGRMATAFIPSLAQADGNGPGQNFLIQSPLRAGHYRVDVKAVDSAGHLGLLASPAPLLDGATLVPGGSVRASLPGGSGVAFPIDVAGPPGGRYHLDVLSLGAPWAGRLEDDEGWPIIRPGVLDGTETALRPGHYRMVVAPDVVGRDVVARLAAIAKPVAITGHGPHALPFEAPQSATWREPDAGGQTRTPDTWTFSLAGPAEVTLTIADGMVGELHRAGEDGTVAKIVTSWTGQLEAGDYQVLATSLGRNDRLGYTLGLSSPALQPDTPRSVSLPASLPFTLADARVVSLTSWGGIPVKAVLREDGGAVIARYNSRADDWNIAASRLLPAGSYVLDLQSAAPPDLPSGASASSADDSTDQVPDSQDGDQTNGDDQAAQTKATQAATPSPASVQQQSTDSGDDTDQTGPTVQVRLALPAVLPPAPAPAQTAQLAGRGVHVLTLSQPDAGTLLTAAASSTAPLVLTLERAGTGGWQTVALATGHSPVVAVPADADPAAWRVETWTIDGGAEPIRLAARALAVPPQPGSATLAAVPDMPVSLAVAHVQLADAGIASIAGAPADLLAGGWTGHALDRAGANVVAAGDDLWLLASHPGTAAVTKLPFAPGQETVVQLPAGLAASLSAPPAESGQVAVWRVASGSGQPNLGLASGIAASSAVALASNHVSVRAATDAMRLRIVRDTVKLLPQRILDASMQTTVPPGAALPLTLPLGDKTLRLDLAPGLAAFADWHDAAPLAVWTGAGAVSRNVDGAWPDLLVVNTGSAPAPASVAIQPAPAAAPLEPGAMLKRFYGAAGSFAVAFDAPPGSKLMTAGDAQLTAVTDTSVGTGTAAPVAGHGRAVIQHGAGPIALWLEAPGAPVWPTPAANTVSLPVRMPLAGNDAALTFTAATPVLLHVSTTAPVYAGLAQGGQTEPPELFAAGAELHRAVAAGPVTVTFFSPSDGPLSGSVSVWAEPLIPTGEGLGESVALAPGGTAAFSFTLAKADTIGVGLRAEPDQATARLLDATGAVVGEGVAQLRDLKAGAYVLEARVPPTAPPTVLRPALVGITPRGNGPPPDVVQNYLELVGMKPQKAP